MHPLLWLFDAIVQILIWIVIASAIVSWLVAFNVVNMRNNVIRVIVDTLYRLTEPMLRPIRRFLPNMGGVDISPVILLLAIYFVQYVVHYYFVVGYY
ncbi:MAG TPA: YggT family protein [Reyranella sp.]|nr:YggT family protein [Reyranella sp.]